MTLGRREITQTATLSGGPDDILGVAQRHALVANLAAVPAEDLPPADRLFYNNAAGFWTPEQDQMLALLLRTMDRNAAASAAVQAIAVEGPSGSGKSRLVEDTVMAVIGRNILEAQTMTEPDGILTRSQPLVWALGGSSGNKSFAARLCTTMGIPVSSREESNALLNAAAKQMRRAQTQIAVVEDLHALSRGQQSQGVNFLRMALNLSNATWIFTTLDLRQGTPVLAPTGANADQVEQVLRRTKRLTIGPVEPTKAGIGVWNRAFNDAIGGLKLLKTTSDDEAAAISVRLFHHTQGWIAPMFDLVKEAAAQAVGVEERLTHYLIDTVIRADLEHTSRTNETKPR
jgi:hypothetical protein